MYADMQDSVSPAILAVQELDLLLIPALQDSQSWPTFYLQSSLQRTWRAPTSRHTPCIQVSMSPWGSPSSLVSCGHQSTSRQRLYASTLFCASACACHAQEPEEARLPVEREFRHPLQSQAKQRPLLSIACLPVVRRPCTALQFCLRQPSSLAHLQSLMLACSTRLESASCLPCTGIINTPLTRHIYGSGYLGGAIKSVVGVLASPWLKSPAQGAATSITAAVSPELESHSGKVAPLALDSGRLVDISDGDGWHKIH